MEIIFTSLIIGYVVTILFFQFLEKMENKAKKARKVAFVFLVSTASAAGMQYPVGYKVVIIRPDQRPTVQVNKTVSMAELDSLSKANFYGAVDIVWMLKYSKNIYIKIDSLEFSVDTREIKGKKPDGDVKLGKLIRRN
jgi:hypothetical protein